MAVGTYTATSSRGVYLLEFDGDSAEARILHSVQLDNPSYVVFSHDGNHLYAIGENGANGTVHSIALSESGMQVDATLPAGADPCHIALAGDLLVVASYSDGAVNSFSVDDRGILASQKQSLRFKAHSVHPRRQMSSHIHNIALSPDGRFILASDLGGDFVYSMVLDDDSVMQLDESVKAKAGSGPRHMAWSRDGKYLYLLTELSDEVMVFARDGGRFTHIQTLGAARTPAGGGGDIHIHPDGHFLYASARLQDDGIAVFGFLDDGTLKKDFFVPTGKHPRNFAITPDGRFLLCACRDKNAIEVYEIDCQCGNLTYLDNKDIELPMPVCIAFDA